MRKNDIITLKKGVEEMAYDRKIADKKYNESHKKIYSLAFHNEKDKDIIKFFEDMKSQGVSPTQVVRKLLKGEV